MNKYIIEREIPGIGSASQADLAGATLKSCSAIQELNNNVQWIESYVTANKTYCVYLAESKVAIEDHARVSGFPANSIQEVNTMIDPTTK